MIIYHKIKELREELDQFRLEGKKICLVPTMGALHDGHMSLIQKGHEVAEVVVCCIFVNPTQFNQSNDLDNYPRTIGADLRMLDANKCTVVFIPEVDEVYPNAVFNLLKADYGALTNSLEGEKRPGHFDGVVTIVKRLFDIVEPNFACFGLKDFQQISIVKRLVKEYSLNIEIVDCAIKREVSGLAMSSRNALLSDAAKEEASIIYETLSWIKDHYSEHNIATLQPEAIRKITDSGSFEIEYLEFVHPDTFIRKEQNANDLPVVVLFAGWIDGVRLIDNIRILK